MMVGARRSREAKSFSASFSVEDKCHEYCCDLFCEWDGIQFLRCLFFKLSDTVQKRAASSLESFVLLQRGEEGRGFQENIGGTSGPAEKAGRGARRLAETHFAIFVSFPNLHTLPGSECAPHDRATCGHAVEAVVAALCAVP